MYGPGGNRGRGVLQSAQNLGSLDFLGSKRNLGKANFLTKFACICVRVVVVFFRRERLSILNLSQRGKAS